MRQRKPRELEWPRLRHRKPRELEWPREPTVIDVYRGNSRLAARSFLIRQALPAGSAITVGDAPLRGMIARRVDDPS